ncbi:MAG TPA: hypothetical protein VFZ95_11825 [Steroidobacteraceae bacterium]
MSRFRSILWQGAASALLVGEPAIADPPGDTRSAPQWVVRARQRLGLQAAQQSALRILVDDHAAKMQSLPGQLRREELESLQQEFRAGLSHILEPGQLAEWDLLLQELLGAVNLRHAPALPIRH